MEVGFQIMCYCTFFVCFFPVFSQQCKDLIHPNICSFIGACLDSPHFFLLTEFCPKGSLQVLFN
uniref:Serine-threonine/tyrosine-protein kinase catalytic domain-containing protein n=1 Tax=Anguilla anguilla TaxID=7936 RepID=A0A0E9QRX0_ANGAN